MLSRSLIISSISAIAVQVPVLCFASGVPTLDVATGIILQSNAVAQETQALNALKTAKNGIEQARQQHETYKSMNSGNDKLGRFLNDPALNKVLPMGPWAELYGSVKDIAAMRKQYGLTSSNANVQAKFDRMLASIYALERTYDASTQRVKNAEQLRAKLDEVETPQQKEDLQLRYQQELLEQQNQQMRLANIRLLQEQQEKLENQGRAQAFDDFMLGRSK